jgi:hypothetical protein
MQLKRALFIYNRMPSIVSTSIPNDIIDITRKVIDYFTFPFISPLTANYGICRHINLYDLDVPIRQPIQGFGKYKREYTKTPLAWKAIQSSL